MISSDTTVWVVWFVLKVSRPRLSPGGRGTAGSVYSHSRISFLIFIDVDDDDFPLSAVINVLSVFVCIVCVCVCTGGHLCVIYLEHALHSGAFPLSLTLWCKCSTLLLKIYLQQWFMGPAAFIGPKWKANKVFIDTYISSCNALWLVKFLYPVLPLGGNSLHSTLVLCHQ